MISTQRLLIILIAINIMIGIAVEIYRDPTEFTLNQIQVEKDLIEQHEQEMESQEGIWGSVKATTGRIYESSIGSPLKWGYTVLKIFIRGINPFSFKPTDFTHQLEQMFAAFIIILRCLINVIIFVELIMLYKNRKTS